MRYLSGEVFAALAGLDAEYPLPENDATRAAHNRVAGYVADLRKVGLGLDYNPVTTPLAEFTALPVAAAHDLGLAPTADDVAAVAGDLADDPHEFGAEFEAAKDALRREKQARRAALTEIAEFQGCEGSRLDARTEFAVAGLPEEWRAAAQRVIDTENYKRRNDPHVRRAAGGIERHPIIKAVELRNLGMEVAEIAALTPATFEDLRVAEVAAKAAAQRERDDINLAARLGDTPEVDLYGKGLTLAQMRVLPSPEPLVGHFLYRGELSELVGEPGAGKSYCALDWACSLAVGLSTPTMKVSQAGKVVYVVAEGARGMRARAYAWFDHHGYTQEQVADRFIFYPEPVQIASERDMARVREYVKAEGVELVVFDTRALCTEGLEENSATDQGRAISQVKRINRETDAAVLVIHHTARGATHGRGSNSWPAAVNTSMLMEKVKTRAGAIHHELTCPKQKDAAECDQAHLFQLQEHVIPVELLPDDSEDARTTAVLVPMDPYELEVDLAPGLDNGHSLAALDYLTDLVTENPSQSISLGRAHALLQGKKVSKLPRVAPIAEASKLSQAKARALVQYAVDRGRVTAPETVAGKATWLSPGPNPGLAESGNARTLPTAVAVAT